MADLHRDRLERVDKHIDDLKQRLDKCTSAVQQAVAGVGAAEDKEFAKVVYQDLVQERKALLEMEKLLIAERTKLSAGICGPSGGTASPPPDCSRDLCKELLSAVADLPDPGEDFNKFLEQGRVPVVGRAYADLVRSCPELAGSLMDMGSSNDTLAIGLSACVICPPQAAGKSEEMTGHAFFGSVLWKVWPLLDKFAPLGSLRLAGGIDKNRKPAGTSVTVTEGDTRPDFVVVVDSLLLAAGEEKTAGFEVDAIADIKRKLSGGLPPLYYQGIPYIPIYISCGNIVQFGLVRADGTLYLTGKRLDISNNADTVYALLASINMYRLVVALAPKASAVERRQPLLCAVERPHDTVILLKPKTVVKSIYCADAFFKRFGTSFAAVKAAYASARTSSFMVHAADPVMQKPAKRLRSDGTCTDKGAVYRVEMDTVGWDRDPASLTEQDLKAVVHAALHGLAKLHKLPSGKKKRRALVHRDIRLANFLWRLTGGSFLADLELAAFDGNEAPLGVTFADWDDSTLSNGRYTCSSDVYQVGVMMRNFSRTKPLSNEGALLMTDLLSKQVTAEAGLGYAWLGCPGGDD